MACFLAVELPRRCTGHLGKWHNMHPIDMSGKLPMRRRTENAQVRHGRIPHGRGAYAVAGERKLLWQFTEVIK